MNLQAHLPTGLTEMTVHGLYQWDYGRTLEIKSASLASRAVAEVHFACAGMTEAVVRSCAVNLHTVTAAIPDSCLEQTSPIYAWVFCPDATEGFTVLKITMPVSARTRPAGTASEPPADYSNAYTELIAAANAVIANTYPRAELELALGSYITEIDSLIGGGV